MIAIRISTELGGMLAPAWLFLALREIRGRRWSYQVPWTGLFAAIVLPPLVLTNVYYVHDYYLAAVSPAIALLVGLAGSHLVARWRGGIVVGALLASGWCLAFWSLRDYVVLPYSLPAGSPQLAIAAQLSAQTDSKRFVALITHSDSWDPS